MKFFIYAFFFIILFIKPIFPYADQTNSERILKENISFIEFINVCLTNYGDDSMLKQLKDIYETHFNGFVAFLQADYKRTFKKVFESQKKQVLLYEDLVKNIYLEDSKEILDKLAPIVIRSKNSRASLYLRLGYRDRTIGRNNYVSGNATNPRLCSNKLNQYIKAIKRSRRAKRYGFLALFESQTDETKREIYNDLFISEMKNGNIFFNRFADKKADDFVSEINNKFEVYEGSLKQKKPEGEVNAPKTEVSEKKVEKKTRFRNEKRAAEHLLYFQFDRANDIFKEYVNDLNFKIILSAFEILQKNNKDTQEFNYQSFKLHHTDDYSRLSKGSIIEQFIDSLKIEGTKVDNFNSADNQTDKPAEKK